MLNNFDIMLTQKYVQKYKNATKKGKAKILAEYCKLTNINKNTASKRFRKNIKTYILQL